MLKNVGKIFKLLAFKRIAECWYLINTIDDIGRTHDISVYVGIIFTTMPLLLVCGAKKPKI